jgi:hypothetical protein
MKKRLHSRSGIFFDPVRLASLSKAKRALSRPSFTPSQACLRRQEAPKNLQIALHEAPFSACVRIINIIGWLHAFLYKFSQSGFNAKSNGRDELLPTEAFL